MDYFRSNEYKRDLRRRKRALGIEYIYVLVDPLNNQVRYVGKTWQPKTRIKTHIREAQRMKFAKDVWISSLISRGKLPILIVVETTSVEFVDSRERYWIAKCITDGCNLTNRYHLPIGLDKR